MTTYLTTADLLAMIEAEGLGPIRDAGLLDAAAHRPSATLLGSDAYPTLDMKASALLDSLLRNHPLVDGNKRIGWLATTVFYRLNGARIDAPEDDAYHLVIGIATSHLELEEIADQLAAWRHSDQGGPDGNN